MGQRTGRADLPLHGGRVPKWLATRMSALGRVIVEALVLEYGRAEVFRRLAHPFWFQSFGAVMGMDWHSSGITTSVVGALKRGLAPVADELGIYVCGGRGRQSRKTPAELTALGERVGVATEELVRTSRLVAKVDNVALQDGFQIYLHAFIAGAGGEWAVVQQGMNGDSGMARRYHWLSEGLESFIDDPHAAIAGTSHQKVVNLADRRAAPARGTQLEVLQRGADAALTLYQEASGFTAPAIRQPHLFMPTHHDVRPKDVVHRRLFAAFAAAEDAAPDTFESLLLVPGMGPRSMASLALVAEVIYGRPSRFTDPARFSFAMGGKDGHPFPVPLDVYDATLSVLRAAVGRAKLEERTRLEALRRLGEQARSLEAHVAGDVGALIAHERMVSHRYGGMTVSGPAKPPKAARNAKRKDSAQLGLFKSPR